MVFLKVLGYVGTWTLFLSPLTLNAYTASSQLDHSHCLITSDTSHFDVG